MRLYFDSAYVAKCYLNEPDAEAVRELARSASALHSSALCIAEVACVFHRQFREGVLPARQASVLRKQFRDDVGNDVWNLIPIANRVLQDVELLVRNIGSDCYLRAADAIHLASAIGYGFEEVWTNNRHLLKAASRAGLTGRAVKLQ